MFGGQPEATQFSADEEEIQDGRSEDDQGPDEKGRLDGICRPQGRVPFGTHMLQPPSIPEVPMEGSDIRIPMPSLRTQQCIHEAIETGDSPIEEEGNSLHDLLGRHASDGPNGERAGVRSSR